MNGPCWGCEERHIGCHSECPRYIEFAGMGEEIRREKQNAVMLADMSVRRTERKEKCKRNHERR